MQARMGCGQRIVPCRKRRRTALVLLLVVVVEVEVAVTTVNQQTVNLWTLRLCTTATHSLSNCHVSVSLNPSFCLSLSHQVSLWVRNVQLGLYGAAIGYVGYLAEVRSFSWEKMSRLLMMAAVVVVTMMADVDDNYVDDDDDNNDYDDDVVGDDDVAAAF